MCRRRDSSGSDDSLVYYGSWDIHHDRDTAYSEEELSEKRAEERARRAREQKEKEEFILKLWTPLMIIIAIVFFLKHFYKDLTFNNTFDLDSWQETKSAMDQETRHELETILQASKIAMALEIFKLMPTEQQLEFNKWIPVPSLFIGVDDYLRSINKLQTSTHQFMYFAEPKFQINENATELIFEWGDFKHRQTFVKGRSDCDNCPIIEWSCKDGILTIKEDTLFVNRKFTRVYY